MNRNRRLGLVFLLALGVVAGSWAAETPGWEIEFVESDRVELSGVKWHEKDYGWLMTARLLTKSRYTIRRVTHLRFEGLDAEEEILWEGSKTIRRKDLSANLNGQMEMFVRMLLKDVPARVTKMKVRFENGREKEAASD